MIDSSRHDDVLTTWTEPADLATRWSPFSARELARLRFLVYRRRTGRIRPPVPVRAEVNALCAALLATSGPPDPQPPQRPIPGGGVLSRGCFLGTRLQSASVAALLAACGATCPPRIISCSSYTISVSTYPSRHGRLRTSAASTSGSKWRPAPTSV